jgi:hypothetical protein
MLAATSTDRRLAFHPLGIAHVRQFIRSVLFVFLPNSILDDLKSVPSKPVMVGLAVALVVFSGLVFVLIRKKSFPTTGELKMFWKKSSPLMRISLLFLVMYPLFLVVSISFADYTTPLSYRIMLPEFVLAFPLLFASVCKIRGRLPVLANRALGIACLALFAAYAVRAGDLFWKIHSVGLGYSSARWKNSKILSFIRRLPPNTTVYTNGGAGVYYQTGIVTKAIPYKYVNGKTNPRYSRDLEAMLETVKSGLAVIAYFNDIPSSLIPTPEELASKLASTPTIKNSEGVVFSNPVGFSRPPHHTNLKQETSDQNSCKQNQKP